MHHDTMAPVGLRASTPAFVPSPTFVFAMGTPVASRSELLRRRIAAAQEARRAPAP